MMSSLEPEDLQILNGSRSFNRQIEIIKENNRIQSDTTCSDYYLMNSSKKAADSKSRKSTLRHKVENSKKKRHTQKRSNRTNKWKTYKLSDKSYNQLDEVTQSENSSGIVNNPMYQTNYMDLTETKKSIYKSLDKPRKKKKKIPEKSNSSNTSESENKHKYKNREIIMSRWDLILKAADDPKDLKKILHKKLSPKSSESKGKHLDMSKNSKNLDFSTSRPDEMVKSFFAYLNNYGDDGYTLKSLNKTKEKTSSFINMNSIFPLFGKSEPKFNLSNKKYNIKAKCSDTKSSKLEKCSQNKSKISLNCCSKHLTDSNVYIDPKPIRFLSDDELDKLIEKLGNNEEILFKLKNKLSLILKSKKSKNFYFAVSPQHKTTLAKNENFFRGLCKHLSTAQLPASSTPNPDLLIQNFSASNDSLTKNNYFFKQNQDQCLLSSIEQSQSSSKEIKKKYSDGKIFQHQFGKISVQPNEQTNLMSPNGFDDKRNFRKAKQCNRNANKIVQMNTRKTRVKSSKQILKEISEKCQKPVTPNRTQKIVPSSFTNYCYYQDNLLRKDKLRSKTSKVKTKKINSFLDQNENIYNDPAKEKFLY